MIIALWACSAVHATPAPRTSSDPSQPPHYMDEPDESYVSIPVRQSILPHRGSQSASPPSADTQGTTISRLTGSLTRSLSTLLKSQIIAHTVPRSRQQQQQPVIASASTRPNRASSPPPHPPSCPAEYPLPVEYRYHSDFPPDSQWLTWECLTATYRPTLLSHNGPDEVSSILSAIETTSHEAGIDPYAPLPPYFSSTRLTRP